MKDKKLAKFPFYNLKIRSKLISIISLIIITSLSSMIFLATFFFSKDNEIRIKESNLKISEVIALKVKTDFTAIVEKLNLMGTTMVQEFRSNRQKTLFIDLFFTNDKDLIYVGIGKKVPGSKTLQFTKSIFNKEFLKETEFSEKNINTINRYNSQTFIQSYNDEAVVRNVSDNFKMPVIGISLPFQRDVNRTVLSVIVAYMKLDRFLQAFKTSGITESYMLNSKGDIIAHPNSKIVMSQVNYINLPIVQKMIKSKLDNGQTKYKDEKGASHFGSFKKIGFSGIGVIATVPEDKAFAAIYTIQKRNIYIMVIVLNLAILVVYFFGKTLTTPIVRLVEAAKEIEKGNFRVDITPTTRDEIGILTSSFSAMGQGLEEREKMKDAFGKFVNKEIAEQVLKGEVRLGGERTDAAVFFSDIRSFTAISEKLEPEEVVEFLNQYMTRMVNCVNATYGVVDKYIGDAIMAIWGAPVSRGNDTELSINAALMMRKELLEFNKDRGSEKKPIIKIGCGINSGPVLAGQIGSNDRMEYTVIGDTVNLASRIEALNKPFGTDVLISSDSYKLVREIFLVEPMQKIKVKGKNESQQVYAILGRFDDPTTPKSLEQLRDMVGIDMKGKPTEEIKDEVKYEIIE